MKQKADYFEYSKQFDEMLISKSSNEVKIKMDIRFAIIEFTAMSFEDGLNIANEKYERMGLIGRVYISSSCGKQTSIH